MNENTNPEIIPEEQPEAVGEPEEIVENTAEAVEETAQTAEETVEEAVEEAVEETENAVEETVEPVPAETAGEIAEEVAEQPKKKKRLIQIPVIISLCLVVAVLLSYFVFTAFFLREPEGVTWTTEFEGVPYYFEFDRDGVFKGYVGSVEIESTYAKAKNEDNQNTLTVNTTVCNFYSGYPATYTVTGSRILGNQTLNFSYGEGYDYTLTQSKREKVKIELPKDFTPDEKLLGEWVFQYYGYEIYRVNFKDDGSIVLKFVQDGITYNGTYTVEDGKINFTYYVSDAVAAPLDYSIEGETLNFMGAAFVRPDKVATADQQAPAATSAQ